MRRIASRWRRVGFVAAVAGALGFGATQALAAPSEPGARAVCSSCWGRCPQFGGDYVNGRCICCLP
jgi:hypothetical protein